MEPIRVIIADDHPMLRQGLALFLEKTAQIELVGQATNGHAAIDLCHQLRPDVVLMDLIMPGMDGIESTQIIRQRFPEIQVIALTSYDDDARVRAVVQAGAISYLLKHASTQQLAHAIHAAYRGESVLAHEAAQALVRASQPSEKNTYHLTPRQREVLRLMIEGATNREIASQLTISASTVKKHVSNILAALNVESRTHAVALAVEHQLIDDGSASA